METEEAMTDTRFDIYDSYFRYKEPVSEQLESKISKRNIERGFRLKKNSTINTDDLYHTNRLFSH